MMFYLLKWLGLMTWDGIVTVCLLIFAPFLAFCIVSNHVFAFYSIEALGIAPMSLLIKLSP
jgi:hypothetical protein